MLSGWSLKPLHNKAHFIIPSWLTSSHQPLPMNTCYFSPISPLWVSERPWPTWLSPFLGLLSSSSSLKRSWRGRSTRPSPELWWNPESASATTLLPQDCQASSCIRVPQHREGKRGPVRCISIDATWMFLLNVDIYRFLFLSPSCSPARNCS